MKATKGRVKTIDEYVGAFPQDVQGVLEKMRQTIRDAAPEAEEAISYQIPAFRLNGKILVYFAAFKHHVGLYPPVPKALRKEASPYLGPKGNLKFPTDGPIPLDLVRKIVKYRTKEILEKGRKKDWELVAGA